MGKSSCRGVRVAGIAACVPDRVMTWEDDARQFGESEMQKIRTSTGIAARRVAPRGICTSDLCFAAAKELLGAMSLAPSAIDVVILVTQTPDYVLPATACSLANRLGLPSSCAAFDVNLGCSGYTYGLWLASHLIAGNGAKRVLLLAGDIATRPIHPNDRSARPLFGDAGSATVVEASEDESECHFITGTDGAGQNSLIIPAGGSRLPCDAHTGTSKTGADGNERSLENLYMNGPEIFSFTIQNVPGLLLDTARAAGWTVGEVDAFVLHQANAFMINFLTKAAKVPESKVPLSLRDYGNTSSASIPVTMVACLREQLATGPFKAVLAGFGVGFSWSSAALTLNRPMVLPMVELPCDEALRNLCDLSLDATSHLPEELRRELAPTR
jgi:3-oxoacyl-[acyl-carrier-protein] synthase-3